MRYHGETVLELMGARLLSQEGGQLRPCAIILTEAALYVTEDAPERKAARIVATAPMPSILSMEKVEPQPGDKRPLAIATWVAQRRWAEALKVVARVVLVPVAGFFTVLADHFSRREEEPDTRLLVRYRAEDGEIKTLTFVRCEGDIDLLLHAWQRKKSA